MRSSKQIASEWGDCFVEGSRASDSHNAAFNPNIDPQVGEKWRSRDKRDDGLLVTVLGVTDTHVHIKRFNKTRVRRDRFMKEYEYVAD